MTWNRLKTTRRQALGLLALPLLLLSSCGVYSFNGTNIDPAVKTISIQTFQNTAPNAPAYLSQRFTEDIKDYFQRNTTLKLVPRDGDLQFEGTIVAYDFAPAAIQQAGGLPSAGANRLTIQVQLRFTNTKNNKQDFEQTFQSQRDFASTQDIASINNDLASVREITRNIISDMFNKSVANW
ncbi:LptE family protein [Hymenobacter baengnokdamensis]|uniref:LptE family protein n=1 Tax=Hymenobacter baengnokdamensis TaxID=2615203 RepID=UPI0012482A57|nr:LptE family protein [Hymenobacter baengnokdamensis]